MPHYKPKSSDIMTKSLSLLLNKNDINGSLLNMSKSLASFHLTGTFLDKLVKYCISLLTFLCIRQKVDGHIC